MTEINKQHEERGREEYLGFIFVLLATLGIGLQAPAVKLCFTQHIDILTILMTRIAIFLPFYGIYLCARKRTIKLFAVPKKHMLYAAGAGFLGYYLLPLINLRALSLAPAGVVTVVQFTYPLFVVLFNSIRRRIWPSRIYLLVFLAMLAGTYLVTGARADIFYRNINGALLALLASVVYAMSTLAIRDMAAKLGTQRYMFYAASGAMLALIIHFLAVLPVSSLQVITPYGWWLLVFYSAACFIPSFMIVEGLQKIGVVRTSLITASTPFLTIIFAYFLLGETLVISQWLGGIIVIFSVLLLEKKMFRLFISRGKARQQPVTSMGL